MRGKRKSNSVNRTEHKPYASYPLPQHTTHLEEAVAWVAAGRGSLRQAMRLFTVDKKTIKKNLLRFMNSEPVVMGRPGPPPRVQDLHMRKWLEQQLLSSLTPYKHDIVEEARRHAEEHGFKLGSGNKWWRLFKARNTDVVSRTPGLVESQRADSRFDEDQWQDFFAEASKALADVDYDGRYIVNMDETSFHQNFITGAAARKVYSIRGRRSVPRRQGYQRKAVTVIAAVVASGEALLPTLLFDTKTVKGTHLRYCDREVILKGMGTGWSSSEIFVEWVEQVLVPRLSPLSNPYNKILLFLDGSRTHLGVRGLTVCKKAGVSVVLFPSHATDIIQPLDRALFRGVKCPYRQLQDQFIKSNLGRSLGVARFVSLVEQAWYQTCTGEKVRTAFRVTGLVPHSVETFLRHAPEERLRPKQKEADVKALELLSQLASRIVPASDICPASQDSPSTTREMGSQATARTITMETKDDASTLRLGGWVTKTSFLAAAQAAQQERDQQEEAKARRKTFKQARHRGMHAQARQAEPVAKRARTSAEAFAAPHTSSRLKRPHTNTFAGGSRHEKRCRQCDERSERAAKRQVTDSDTSSEDEANASAFACYVTHDSGLSMDIDTD